MASSSNPILFVLSFLEYEYFVFLIGQEFVNGLKHGVWPLFLSINEIPPHLR